MDAHSFVSVLTWKERSNVDSNQIQKGINYIKHIYTHVHTHVERYTICTYIHTNTHFATHMKAHADRHTTYKGLSRNYAYFTL